MAFVLVSSLSAWRLVQLHNEIRLRDQTSAVEQKLTDLYTTLLNADVTFLVLRDTGAVAEARKLLRLIAQARTSVTQLTNMVPPGSPIRSEVLRLDKMVSEKLSLSERVTLNINFNSGEPFQRVLVIKNDLLLTEKVNETIQSIEAYLITNLDRHRAHVDRYFDVNLLSIGATATVAFALMLTFAGLVWSEIRRRRLLEADLRQAQQAAIHASELKSQFLATVSHEVRTPLNGIIGMSELLQQRLKGEAGQFASVIQASGRTLLRIVNDLLDFSKIEANKLNVEIQEVRLNQILETAVDLFNPRAAQKRLRIYCSYPIEFNDLYASDGVRISQIIQNLLSNAVKFTQKGFVELKGQIVATQEELLTLRFEVADTGPGIDSVQSASIFEPFFQIKPDFQNEGTGLGLAITKRLVDLLGGRIGLQSRPEVGSLFWFELPLRRLKREFSIATLALKEKRISSYQLLPEDVAFLRRMAGYLGGEYVESLQQLKPDDFVFTYKEHLKNLDVKAEIWLIGFETDLASSDRRHIGYALSPGRFIKALVRRSATEPVVQPVTASPVDSIAGSILLVEDNPTNQLLAKTQLEQLGYRVEVASNGAECLESLRKNSYRLILMDCRMPVMDGFEVTRRIREREQAERLARMPIIAMTAHALEDDRQRCLAAGMDDHIAKPTDVHRLHRLIQKWAPDYSVVIDSAVVSDLEAKTSKQVVNRLFRSFYDTLSQGCTQFETLSSRRDWAALGSLCHQLRSAAAAVGALVLSRSLERVENIVEQKMEPETRDIEELVRLSKSVLEELNRRLSENSAVDIVN